MTDTSPERTGLVLGPLLRYVGRTDATVWVETAAACTVEVLGARARTFVVHGHHYALVRVQGLQPGTQTAYEVHLDGERVWPEAGSAFPPSVICTRPRPAPLELVFGSCRTSVAHTEEENRKHGIDTLRTHARRMMRQDPADWPTLLLLVGDQVYADEPSDEMEEFIKARRDVHKGSKKELADFEEYTELYRLAWTEPSIRWVLSVLPSVMIFDDHDVRDDWNTSDVWRRTMAEKSWWPRRIVGALGSYWLYQHVGNFEPAQLDQDALLARLQEGDGDGGKLLDEFAWESDQHPGRNRFSYSRDLEDCRLVVIDSRAGRITDPRQRRMVDEPEWQWIDERLTGDLDHLLIATSLPYLLPEGVHDVEAWNEAVCAGVWGRGGAVVGEKVRQALDLEHWAAFRHSFDQMAASLTEVATGRRGRPPASVLLLSGDVHYSYVAEASLAKGSDAESRVYQLVCSPVRNPLPRLMRLANGAAQFGVARLIGHSLARLAGLGHPHMSWDVTRGPWFANALATVSLDGRAASVRWETSNSGAEDELEGVARVTLT